MRKRIPYLVTGLAVIALLLSCDAFRVHKKVKFVVADWFGLIAGETKNAGLTFTRGDAVQACWIAEMDTTVPAYVRDMNIDSIHCDITNKDTSRGADFALYVGEDSVGCDELSPTRKGTNSPVKIAAIHLDPSEQVIIDGDNFDTYILNQDLLVNIIKDGHFWAFAVAAGTLHVHVEVENYTVDLDVEAGIF